MSLNHKINALLAIQKGEMSISRAAKILCVSRQTIYSWLKKINGASGFSGKMLALKRRNRRIWVSKISLKPATEAQIFKLIKYQTNLNIFELYKYVIGKTNKNFISLHGFVNCLKRNNLWSDQQRSDFAHSHDELPLLFRKRMTEKVIIGKYPAVQVAREYQISRQQLYKWVTRYRHLGVNGLVSKIPKANSNLKTDAKTINQVLNYIAANPQMSYSSLYRFIKNTNPALSIGRHALFNLFKKYNLSKIGDRYSYSAKFAPLAPEIRPVVSRDSVSVPALDELSPNVLPGPPPPSLQIRQLADLADKSAGALFPKAAISLLFKFFIKILSYYIKLPFRQKSPLPALLIAMVIPVSIYGLLISLYNYVFLYISAPSIYIALGYLFASIALLFGLFFFLYSIKYYLSTAIVLWYSRKYLADEKGDLLQKKQITNTGLVPDLSHITLDRHPFVSVHIAMYNEKRVVNRLLEAATSMDYDNFEVVVCDDSTDETIDIIREWQNHPKVRIAHRDNREGYKGGALQGGLKMMDSRTEFVMVFDADFLPYPDSIKQFLKYFKARCGTLDFQNPRSFQTARYSDEFGSMSFPRFPNDIAVVQGYQWHVLNKSENWITRGVRTEYAGSYVIERSSAEVYQGLKQISGSVYMIRADVLRQYGWGTSITEDFELTLKLYRDGWKVVYTPYVQAPSECVSTLKRLVRQRMRWAEGHSQNVKRMFVEMLWGRWVEPISNIKYQISNIQDKISNTEVSVIARNGETKPACAGRQSSISNKQITAPSSDWVRNDKGGKVWLPSKLTLPEKLEFLYLFPYYIQSAFFILGTISWFISEVVFRTKLPFWTAVWGWSLVLTNMLSLPLMNTVGLFLEEAEEKDYSGIPAFIFLSYIVAPFQAYAAVKGFIEDKEGPWFRTPKTGKITDIYRKGRFYRWITGIFGRPAVEVHKRSFVNNRNFTFAFINNRITKSEIRPVRRKFRWLGKTALIILMIISLTIYNYSGGRVDQVRAISGTGNGHDGAKSLTSGTDNTSFTATNVDQLSTSGQKRLYLANTGGMVTGQDILFVIQVTGTGQGNYEICSVNAITSMDYVDCVDNLNNTYQATGAQAVIMPQWTSVTVNGATLTASAWDGTTGGVVAFKATGTVDVQAGGSINANGLGFSATNSGPGGGKGSAGGASAGNSAGGSIGGKGGGGGGQGGSYGAVGTTATAGGGGGGGADTTSKSKTSTGGSGGSSSAGTGTNATSTGSGASGGGGGGAGGTTGAGGSGGTGIQGGASGNTGGNGESGTGDGGNGGSTGNGSVGGVDTTTYGTASLSSIYFGSEGGNGGVGAVSVSGGTGGNGGGIIYIIADTIKYTSTGVYEVNGSAGTNGSSSSLTNSFGGGGGGGGGSGGSLYLRGGTLTLNSSNFTATGGAAGEHGDGRNGAIIGTCQGISGLGGLTSGSGGTGGNTAIQNDSCAGGGGAGGDGGAGGVGRVHIEYVSYTGDTNPTSDKSQIPEKLLLLIPLAFILPKIIQALNKRHLRNSANQIQLGRKLKSKNKKKLKLIKLSRGPPG